MNSYLYLLLSIFVTGFTHTQEQWWKPQTDSTPVVAKSKGKVSVTKDARLDKMIDFKATAIPPSYAPEIDGYRVQLYFDSDKNKVNQARATFLASFPKQDTYTEFKAPNFHLKVGNFRTQLEAEKLKSQLISAFPTSIVVPEKVYFPRVDLPENNTD